MNNFNLGEVLTRAWQIIWKHRVLWIFGILAGFARGGSGGGGGGGGGSGYDTGSGDSPIPSGQFERYMIQFGRFLEENWWVIIIFVVFILILSLLFYALGMMGRIGLIKGVYKVENGAESLIFAELWSESIPYFWRIVGMNLLVGLAFAVILIPLILVGVLTAGIGFVCILPLICILVPISWVVAVVVEQAQPAIVIENLGVMDALKRGWEIVKANAVTFIILALIIWIGGAIIGLVFAAPLIGAFVPLIIGAESLNRTLTPVYIALACCALYIPVLIFLSGVLTAYIQSVWTLTYMRLAQPKEETPVLAEANA